VGDQVKLANCPFRALAERSSSLVCGMNLALVRGVMAGAGAAGVRAELRPAPGSCCVVLTVAGQRTR
jgi:predicted ArsR family transcriptional regulator